MSTEFRTATTDELAFVRFCGRRAGQEIDGFRTCFEFGTQTNFRNVVRAVQQGETFIPDQSSLAGDPVTVEDFLCMFSNGRATFGQFPVTVEVGSGEMFRFTVEDDG
jgi:hypothetical protein